MKVYKKILALLLCFVLVLSILTACSSKGSDDTKEPAGEKEEVNDDSKLTVDTSDALTEVVSDVTATLKMYGPGLFAAVGETGTTDMVTGMKRPGYEKLIERWNQLYPNVTLEIEPIPWDNWKAAIQTAALSGDYDILIHGNGNADYSLDLTPYIEGDSEVSESLTFYPYRRNPDNMSEVRPYGLSYALNPVVAVLDKQILQDYGVPIPDASWTLEDMTNIAEKTTGSNPATGKQTYGISMVKASDAYKNYILMGRAFDNVIFDLSPELADSKVSFATEKTEKVFDFMKNLGRFSSPDYLEGLNLANAYTEDHDTAIIWAEEAYNIYNIIKSAGLEDRFMFLPLPQIEEGAHKGITSSNVGDLNICIYKESEQKDLAWTFLKFLVTDPVIQQWLIDTNSIPSNVNSASLLNAVMPADYANAISTIISTSPLGYNSSASLWYDSTWFGTFQSDIVTGFDQLLKGNETSMEVAEKIQGNIENYLSSLK